MTLLPDCFLSKNNKVSGIFIFQKVKQNSVSENKSGNYSSTVALEQSGSETNTESPFQVMLTLDNQNNSGGKLSSGDTGKFYRFCSAVYTLLRILRA